MELVFLLNPIHVNSLSHSCRKRCILALFTTVSSDCNSSSFAFWCCEGPGCGTGEAVDGEKMTHSLLVFNMKWKKKSHIFRSHVQVVLKKILALSQKMWSQYGALPYFIGSKSLLTEYVSLIIDGSHNLLSLNELQLEECYWENPSDMLLQSHMIIHLL